MAGPDNWLGINLGDIMAQGQQARIRDYALQEAQQKRQDQIAERQAYRGLVGPDGSINRGGLGALAEVDPKAYFEVQQHLSTMDENGRKLAGQKYKAAAPLAVRAKRMPYQVRKNFIQSATPYLSAQGWTPEEIASFDPTDQNLDALTSTAMTMEQALTDGKIDWKNIGGDAGGLAAFDQMGNPVGSGNPYAGAAVNQGSAAPAGASPDTDSIWQSLIQQESGGRPGVTGPKTPYGQAQGLTQMLPPTAQAMAGKLNVPWQPQMMTDTSPEAAAYQGRLGRAYFDEGMQKYGGDVEKALMYYHGGPDERLWGPKTRAYAQSVMARAGGGQETAQAAPGYIPGRGKPQYNVVSEQERVSLGLPPGKYQKSPDGKIDALGGSDGQQYTPLSPAEVQSLGLPPGNYQRSSSGKIESIGGQGSRASGQQIALAKTKLTTLRALDGQLARVERNMGAAEKDGWTGFISGMVPGRLDKESNTFDKSVRQLASMVRALTRVPGEGAMSDYESRLAEMTLPSRTDTPEGRRESLNGIRELISNLRSGYQDILGVSDPNAGGGAAPDPLGIR